MDGFPYRGPTGIPREKRSSTRPARVLPELWLPWEDPFFLRGEKSFLPTALGNHSFKKFTWPEMGPTLGEGFTGASNGDLLGVGGFFQALLVAGCCILKVHAWAQRLTSGDGS